MVGIVGPSGSGKSTLARLVQRLYTPESGRVLIDGIDLAMVDTTWLRRQIGMVLQQTDIPRIPDRCEARIVPPGVLSNGKSRAASVAGGRNRQWTAPTR